MTKNERYDDLEAHQEDMLEEVESGRVAIDCHEDVARQLSQMLKRSPIICRAFLRLLSGMDQHKGDLAVMENIFNDQYKSVLEQVAHENYMSKIRFDV